MSGEASEIRRARILDALVAVVYERGFAGASVTSVSSRAKVSRRTFYDEFGGMEDCFLAFLDGATRHASVLISQAFEREESWVAGVRGALASLLVFFDSEPAYAYAVLVEAAAAGAWARERREQHIVTLTNLVERRWGEPEGGHAHSHVTAGVMASLLGVLHTQLVTAPDQPLTTLLGPLMGLVSAPYLDQQEVAREIERGTLAARELLARRDRKGARPAVGIEVPDLLLHPRAHRVRACVLYLAEHPGASNRQVAEAAGVAGRTQISALLGRLHRAGLLVKRPSRPGGPNAWSLTRYGLRVSHAFAGQGSRTPRPHATRRGWR